MIKKTHIKITFNVNFFLFICVYIVYIIPVPVHEAKSSLYIYIHPCTVHISYSVPLFLHLQFFILFCLFLHSVETKLGNRPYALFVLQKLTPELNLGLTLI